MNEIVLVCNTHIHWDPENSDVKLMQTNFLMEEIMMLKEQYSDGMNFPSVVLAGDLYVFKEISYYSFLFVSSLEKAIPLLPLVFILSFQTDSFLQVSSFSSFFLHYFTFLCLFFFWFGFIHVVILGELMILFY